MPRLRQLLRSFKQLNSARILTSHRTSHWMMGLLLGCAIAFPVQSAPLSGFKTIRALTADGQTVVMGQVEFTPTQGEQSRFKLHMDHAVFTDYFLSMREFKCLAGAQEVDCHVPYPYKSPATVTPTDLTWLSHHLLFLFKSPSEFGAKLWNGVYFDFVPEGKGWVGVPQAVDLTEIGAPPDNLNTPPYTTANRHAMKPESRWVQQIRIE